MDVPFLYGTAWKEQETARLVRLALEAGFRGIDTANQRRHYFEAAVGEALVAAKIPRDELWLQTKFNFRRGQDHRLPYDEHGPIATQVAQSFASSLEHLHTDRLDSYVLHGPTYNEGLVDADWEAWGAMERLVHDGRAAVLGVSNVSLAQLSELCARARVKPIMVQNRCYARMGWDRDVRAFCRERGLRYQGFSLLTANPQVLADPRVRAMAMRHAVTPAQVVFAFALAVGMLPLTGTSSQEHMKQDLAAREIELTPAEVLEIERIS
jgi:diketogulonate reductase-like aldo/keto reductase